MSGKAVVMRGDARSLPLPDKSVDLIVTSPPYFALRSYTDDGEHYDGQIGSEETWQGFIAALLECTREWARVLKPEGSLFVDLGDKYSGGGRTTYDTDVKNGGRGGPRPVDGFPAKSLMLLPERYRIACVDELGLICRAVITWSKPNGLPENVTDRVRRSHEDWVHLTRRPRYYEATAEIRTPSSGYARPNGARRNTPRGQRPRAMADTANPLGRLPGSVWEIPTEPLNVPKWLRAADVAADLDAPDHFAAFPTEWPRRLILGWSPPGICVECGDGRRPVVKAADHEPRSFAAVQQDSGRGWHGGDPEKRSLGVSADARERSITGYACACDTPTAPTRPAVVLDPFGGTGTTAAVAKALGRVGVSVDLSSDYNRLARWRCADPRLAAKVQGRVWQERQAVLDFGEVPA